MAIIKPLQSITLKNEDGEDTTYVVASAPAIVETTEPASVASFSDGAEGIPVKSLVADINPVQTGSGDPSPSNVRLITGWTGMNVVRNGFNQWDEEWEVGTLNSDGTNFPSVTNIRSKNYIPVLGSTTYFIKSPYSSGIQIFEYTTDKTYIKRTFVANSTITLAQNAAFIRFRTPDGVTTYANDISINYPSTDHDYHAYNGTTYPISWADEAGTVYGGTLDVTNGVLTVDRVIEEYDGTEDWKKSGTYNGSFYLNTGTQHSVTNYPICSHAIYGITFPVGYAFGQFGFDGTGKVNLNVWIAASGTSLNDFKAYLAAQKTAGTPLQVVTYLATPQTYQLTPQAVMTILGQNNIWADTGDVEVAYCADTKMYIDKVIAAL